MTEPESLKWRRLNGEPITQNLKDAVESTIQREISLGNRLKVCIGSDSQVRGDAVDFATVIVFLREKKRWFYVYQQ